MGIASWTMALTIFRVLVACLVLRGWGFFVRRERERERGLGFWKRFLRGGSGGDGRLGGWG